MKRIFIVIMTVLIAGIGLFAEAKAPIKETQSEIVTYLASLPDVSVTYLTKSMLQRLPKDKTTGPLALLAGKGSVNSIRVFELGSSEAENAGKRLVNAYVSESPFTELLMLQKEASNEVMIYGVGYPNDTKLYSRVLMYSKRQKKNAILIIITGQINDLIISSLVDSITKQDD